MSDDSQQPWSNDPNAPQIPSLLYDAEKDNFAGIIIASMFYGIVIILFFQCMDALLNPANRTKGGTKWGLIVHTSAMFSLVTIFTGMTLDIQSISYINSREFSGDTLLPPGPLGYQVRIYSKAIGIVPSVAFLLNQWLADGLLLYRCYVIYAMNHWVIAFPGLMYLATWAVGIVFLYQTSQPGSFRDSLASNTGIPYNSISLALNVLLTLMIVTRLILHGRNLRNALGYPDSASGLYNAIVTMVVESCALFTVNSLLFIGPWGAKSWVADIFLPILAETQVIAPFLIILRVAKQRALTSDTIASGNIGSIRFESHEGSASGVETVPDDIPTGSMDSDGGIPSGAETAIDEVHYDGN